MRLPCIFLGLMMAASSTALSLPRRPGIFPNVEERMEYQLGNRALQARNLEEIDRRYTPTRTQDESRARVKRLAEDAVTEDEEEASFDSRVLQLSSRRGAPKGVEL
ncbi:hypothetical protein IAU59_004128 [Kwoniella sp. CBS 9459]